MKKIQLVLIGLLSCPVYARQTPTSPATHRTEEYCELIVSELPFNKKASITVQHSRDYSRRTVSDPSLAGETQAMQSFSTAVDALNYLNASGWELVNGFSVTASQQHYLLHRRIPH